MTAQPQQRTFALDGAVFQWNPETETPLILSVPPGEEHTTFYVVAQFNYTPEEGKWVVDIHAPLKLEKLMRVENKDHFKKVALAFYDDFKKEVIDDVEDGEEDGEEDEEEDEEEYDWRPLFIHYERAIEFYIEYDDKMGYSDRSLWMTLHILRP